MNIDDLPKQNVKAYIEDLGLKHNVKFVRTGLDDWADKITELSGDDVIHDPTLDLLVALKRANKISGAQMARLATNHLREVKNK